MRQSYIVNIGDNRSVEQGLWRWVAPISVLAWEVDAGEVPGNASHGNRAMAQGLSKVEIKDIILDVLSPGVVLGDKRSVATASESTTTPYLQFVDFRLINDQQQPWILMASRPRIGLS